MKTAPPGPGPLGWPARLAHGATALAAATLRPRYDGAVPPALLVEPQQVRVALPAGAMHTLEWGAGERTIVLLHGLNANARYWTGVACTLLAPDRRVLAPDLRGHGGTGPLPGGYGHRAIRGDLLAWLDAMQLDRVDLVGHSMGGKVAADLAAACPRRFRCLVLADPVPPDGLHGLLDRAAPLRRAVFAPERGPFASPAELARAHHIISWLRHAEPWMHRAFDANFSTADDGSIHPVCTDAVFAELYDKVLTCPSPLPLDDLRLPVLLVRASFSVMAFGSQVRRLRRSLPQLQQVRLSGEHSLHATNPVGLGRVIAGFVARARGESDGSSGVQQG